MHEPIPYRCLRCHTLLQRFPGQGEVWRSVQDRHGYECIVCKNLCPAEIVESGSLDVRTHLPTGVSATSDEPRDLLSLLAWLQEYHTDEYVYRGQTQEWAGPLVPSMYRGALSPEPVHKVDSRLRLRSVGRRFHELVREPLEGRDAEYVKRVEFNRYLIQLFGYPLGCILSQQCGLTSEGLDVTHDPTVAAFFAIFDFQRHAFIERGVGLIYRIRIGPHKGFETDYARASFYDSPPCVSALGALAGLRRCETWKEALDSFLDYGYELSMASPEERLHRRPLEKLALPRQEIISCRVVQQLAALVLPDVVLSSDYKVLQRPPPEGKAEWTGSLLIEDVAAREGVERFYFRHSPETRFNVPRSPQVLYPKRDALTNLLKAFSVAVPRFVFMTEIGPDGVPHPEIIE